MTVTITIATLLLTSAQVFPPRPYPTRMPVNDITTIQGPEGWSAIGSFPNRPALSLYENQRPTVVLTCEDKSTRVQVRHLTPAQAWPQPEMTLRFGQASRSAAPDVRNIGDQIAYEMRFMISDQVLDSIAQGFEMVVTFNDQTRTFPNPPEELGRAFAEQCATLASEGIRRWRG